MENGKVDGTREEGEKKQKKNSPDTEREGAGGGTVYQISS